ncbi:MAG: LysR substrate-binding domain-containing protein [Alphaproteobacteria bacterium]|nr:LysR substrate-binding domain-containing protein [Alphaproteobacteria bacterium]
MSTWIPSLNAIRAFEATARHRSYRLAAEDLGVTTAAVKQLVKKLEETLNGRLFKGRGQELELTALGEIGCDELTDAFRQINRTVRRMRAATQARRLIVSADPSFAAAWLVPRLQRFKQRNPTVEVLIDSSAEIVDLESGAADVAIRFAGSHHNDLVHYRLFNEVLCAYCSPTLAAGPPKLSRIEDLALAPLIRWDLSHYEAASNTRRWNSWNYWLSALGVDHVAPGDGPRFNDYNLGVQAAIAGHGLIIGSQPILGNLLEGGLLVNPFNLCVETDVGYDLVTTPTALAWTDVVAFIDWVREEADIGTGP